VNKFVQIFTFFLQLFFDRHYTHIIFKIEIFFTSNSKYIPMNSKKERGQFFTTNVDYILTNIDCVGFDAGNIIEPFVGGGDLVLWMKKQDIDIKNISFFDIEPNQNLLKIFPDIELEKIKQDTLLNPPDYFDKFVITNPPYLAKNKCRGTNKKIFSMYNLSDLFRIHLRQLIDGGCRGGIQILPLNFFSSIKKQDIKIRDDFLKKYDIIQLNIFEEDVFDDTSYTICSFKFLLSSEINKEQSINTTFYPSKKNKLCTLSSENNWIFGGEIYKKKEYNFSVDRLTKKNASTYHERGYVLTNIKLNAVDGGTRESRIKLEYNTESLYGKSTDRSFATIIIKSNDGTNLDFIRSEENQKKIINTFNKKLEDAREKYNSLFLTNFRESKNGHGRKRISFRLCYKIINDILFDFNKDKIDLDHIIIKNNMISSNKQTKEWRQKEFGKVAGGSGSMNCEIYQRSYVEKILKKRCKKTHLRFNRRTGKLEEVKSPNKYENGFDYTEDFDGMIINGDKILLFNFRMVCGKGGSQTRTLRGSYQFIEEQLKFSKTHPNYYFANILDGDESFHTIDKFIYLINLKEYSEVKNRCYIGDLCSFEKWFNKKDIERGEEKDDEKYDDFDNKIWNHERTKQVVSRKKSITPRIKFTQEYFDSMVDYKMEIQDLNITNLKKFCSFYNKKHKVGVISPSELKKYKKDDLEKLKRYVSDKLDKIEEK
jgi:hypothetical protein